MVMDGDLSLTYDSFIWWKLVICGTLDAPKKSFKG